VVDDLEHVLAELVRLFLLALARVHLVMSKENIHYNLYVMLVLVYASFPFSFIYMFHSILEFEQSWNFFQQLYNYSNKILYETQHNIYS
jgi:hypothetical protein